MNIVFQIFVNSFISSSFYLLIGLGFFLLYRTTKVFNLSLGSIAMVGGYSFLYFSRIGLPFWASIIFGLLSAAFLGFILEKIIYLPLRRRGATGLNLLITSLGVSIVLEALLAILFTPQIQLLSSFLPSLPVVKASFATITLTQLFTIFSGIILFFVTVLFLRRTKFGKAVRAISDDEEVAKIIGIQTDKFAGYITFFACLLAGWAGIVLGFDQGLSPTFGFVLLLKGVIAVIIGGLASIYGVLVGAIVLGLIENFAVLVFSGEWKFAVAFVVFIVVLLIKPKGILGR
jgi:branched-chain amino acid transport system permease protein